MSGLLVRENCFVTFYVLLKVLFRVKMVAEGECSGVDILWSI